ncbi:unnamed protein product [Heterobilharzia americana]|nr:unnamed protein product [Heterobilharzia americana]
MSKYSSCKTNQQNDMKSNYILLNKQNNYNLSNENKDISLKYKKLLSSKLECICGPNSSKSRQINENQLITNTQDNLITDDCKSIFLKSTVANVFGLGNKKHRKKKR